MNNGGMSFIEAIVEARKAKEAYERLNALWLEAKKVFDSWNMEEKEKAIPFWYQICQEMTIYKNWDDIELDVLILELKNYTINRNQFKEKMKPQTDQVEAELKERKQKYERSRRVASTAYDDWVKSIPSMHKHFAFDLKQSETKKFFIEEMLNM